MKHSLQHPALVLPLLAVIIFFARLHTYYEPMERDAGAYATFAHEMLNGEQLYKDMGDQKPPAIHITYAIAELIAGYGRGAIFLLTVTASISTLCAIYCAGAVIGPGAALWAAIFWTIVSGDLGLQANQPNTEVFTNSLLTWGLVILLHKRRPWSPWIAGFCFAAATLYKHSLVVTPALLCAAYALWPRMQTTRTRAVADVAIIAGIGLCVWSALVGYFAWTGQLVAVKECLVDFNRAYAGSLSENLALAVSKRFLFPPGMQFCIPMLLAAFAGGVLALRKRSAQPWFMLLILGIATGIAVALPGHFFPHYYQLWLPFMCIGAGWGVAMVTQVVKQESALIAKIPAPAVAICLLAAQVPNYLKSPTEWSLEKYGATFAEAELVAGLVNQHLAPGENIYQIGTEPQFYVLTQRRAPGVLSAYGWLIGPLIDQTSRRVIAEFDRNTPELAIVQPNTLPRNKAHPLFAWFNGWFMEHYERAPVDASLMLNPKFQPLFVLYVRKGSDLQKRWMAEAHGGSALPVAPIAATTLR